MQGSGLGGIEQRCAGDGEYWTLDASGVAVENISTDGLWTARSIEGICGKQARLVSDVLCQAVRWTSA